mmetsp:Transcript_113936/g.271278  ORF Transcript_113936/g.271278 Transcript_113936/m.271278 type:complete len:201 (+) Transcript_113936:680-1282(+)
MLAHRIQLLRRGIFRPDHLLALRLQLAECGFSLTELPLHPPLLPQLGAEALSEICLDVPPHARGLPLGHNGIHVLCQLSCLQLEVFRIFDVLVRPVQVLLGAQMRQRPAPGRGVLHAWLQNDRKHQLALRFRLAELFEAKALRLLHLLIIALAHKHHHALGGADGRLDLAPQILPALQMLIIQERAKPKVSAQRFFYLFD